jgi:T-box protein 2
MKSKSTPKRNFLTIQLANRNRENVLNIPVMMTTSICLLISSFIHLISFSMLFSAHKKTFSSHLSSRFIICLMILKISRGFVRNLSHKTNPQTNLQIYLIFSSPSFHNSSRNSLMSTSRSSDGDKLTPSATYSSSSRGLGLDTRQHHHNHLLNQHHNNHHIDDDDKLLDVVGPPHSPLLSSLQQMQSQAHGEKLNQFNRETILLTINQSIYFSFSAFVITRITGWFNFANEAHMEDVRRRLQAADDNERDGSDSNCSDSVGGGGGGAFRPTSSGSPKENSKTPSGSSYPSPNISVGPPIQPPPHLLPYLYPHGIYNHVAPPLSLLHNPAMNPGLFLNAQLALAAQHPALFGHYSGHSPTSPLHNLKAHRFSPYSLPGFHQGSAFDAVTPGQSNTNSERPATNERSLSNSPSSHHHKSPSASPKRSNQRSQSPKSFSPKLSNNNSELILDVEKNTNQQIKIKSELKVS